MRRKWKASRSLSQEQWEREHRKRKQAESVSRPKPDRPETRKFSESVELLRNDRPGPVPNPVKAGDSVEGKVFPPEYRVTKRNRKGQVEEYRYKSFHYDRETAVSAQKTAEGLPLGRKATLASGQHFAADPANTARFAARGWETGCRPASPEFRKFLENFRSACYKAGISKLAVDTFLGRLKEPLPDSRKESIRAEVRRIGEMFPDFDQQLAAIP